MTAKQPPSETATSTPLPPDADPVSPALATTTCGRVQRALEEYVGGTLSEVERAGVDLHVSLCATCRTVADEYFEIVRLASSLPPVKPSPAAEARLRRIIGRALGQTDATGPADDHPSPPTG